MLRQGRRMKAEIGARLDSASDRSGFTAALAVFAFAALMVGREGIETATMLAALAASAEQRDMFVGGAIGVLCAVAMAWAWTRYGRRVNLSRFFQVTAAFMVLFSVQLVIYAFHEFSEAGLLPGVDNQWWHVASEPYGPEGVYGHWLTYGLVLIPAEFLVAGWFGDRFGARHAIDAAGSSRA